MKLIINKNIIVRANYKNFNLYNKFIIRNCSSNNDNNNNNIGDINNAESENNRKCNHQSTNNNLEENLIPPPTQKLTFLDKLKQNNLYIQDPNTNRKSNKVFKFIQTLENGELIDITDKHELINNFELLHNPPGQWICKNCNELNFRRRTNCFNCDKSIRESLPIFKLQLQDWICTKCLIYNYQNRKVCDGCKSDKYAYKYTI